MILEKMPTGKLESLRAEVEAMIVTKVAERRQELQSQLSELLEITGHGNGTRSGRGKARRVAAKCALWPSELRGQSFYLFPRRRS